MPNGHPFGSLLTQLRSRKPGLSQNRLAELTGYHAAILVRMGQGKKDLTGPSGRERILRIIATLCDEGVAMTLDEANALLAAANLPPLYSGLPVEGALIQTLRVRDAPPATPTMRQGAYLPTPPTPLVGREADMADAQRLLERDELRMLTFTGPPGVGKTRLAIEIARETERDFADGAWWVELAPITDPNTVLIAIARALDIAERPNRPALRALQDHLRNKQALLVLDNLEQVLEVGPLIGQVLSAAPMVNVLATSREALRIVAEHRYAVQPLDLGMHSWRSPAVELFAQRATAVRNDFELTDKSGPIVAGLCRRLDGLPLAIELAAAQVALFTPTEILARLDQRLPMLVDSVRDLPARQRTLNATLDWSYNLLTPDEQALFRRLGVFAGGCTLDAAQTFCDVDGLELEAEDGLAELTAKSLMVRKESSNGQSRYAMLETIRTYALDQLKAHGELDFWHEHLADYLAALRTSATSTRRAHFADVDNWRAALRWAVADRIGDLAPALALLHAHHDYGVSWPEQIVWLELVLAHPHIERHPAAHAQALSLLGETEAMQGLINQSVHHLEQGVALCKRHDLRTEIIEMLFSLGMVRRCAGNTTQARAVLQECMQLCHELGYAERIPHLLITQAEVEVIAEDGALARRLVDEAFALGGKDVPFLHGWGLNHQAHALQLLGDWAGARASAQRSLELFNRLEITGCLEQAWSYSALAEIALSEGDALTAACNVHKGLEIYELISEKWVAIWLLTAFAGVAALMQEPNQGARLWGAGEVLRERVGCHIAPASRLNRERTVALLREQLGDERFEAEQAIGRAMTLDQAVAYALNQG